MRMPDPVEAVFEYDGWISVYGLGYVGLSLAAVYLRKGLRVVGVDISEERLRAVGEGRLGNAEAEVAEAVHRGLEEGRFKLTSNGVEASRLSVIKVVTVPVYMDWVSKEPSFDALVSAARSIAGGLKQGDLVVVESSVPPGTTERIIRPVLEEPGLRAEEDFYLAYSPERIYVGRAVRDIEERYPKVIGGIGPGSLEAASRFYERIASKGVVRMGSTTAAEFEKLAEGIYRDVNIALANELALAAMKLGVDFYEARKAANTQPYSHIHLPGPGVGGYCIPLYPYYMMRSLLEKGVVMDLTRTARMLNEAMPSVVVALAEEAWRKMGVRPSSSKATVLGAAFRGNIDDTRLSPSHDIVALLRARGFRKITVHDPYVSRDPVLEELGARLTRDLREALRGASVVVVATRHDEYRGLRLSEIRLAAGRDAVVVDAVGFVEADASCKGLVVLGRPPCPGG